VYGYALTNSAGMKAVVSNYGADLLELWVPDKDKKLRDVVLGHPSVAEYEENDPAFGAIVGRHANRIAKATYTLNGVEYKLAANNGPNNLHSKPGSYFQRFWEVETGEGETGSYAAFSLVSPDGDQGYPGTLQVTVTYTLTEDNSLIIRYDLLSDKDTIANMTNHSYFNLNGHDSGSVLGQYVTINADAFTPSDPELIPTGEIRSVHGTPLDFTVRKQIGQDIHSTDEQIRNGGFDHNFVLNTAGSMGLAATMDSEESGIAMEVYTDLPGMQLYTANGTKLPGKGGAQYEPFCGACFETQFFPDSIHHANFPSCILKAGETFTSETVFHFSVR
jgi:aldose 1-epimerase